MQTHLKKKIEIIIEAPMLNRVLDLLDRLAVTGYTVIPALAGRGREGAWRGAGQVSISGEMVLIICVTDERRVTEVLDPVYELVSRQIGIITLSDVTVVRADHF